MRSVVHEHTYLGTSTRIRGAVIGRGGDIRGHAAIEPGAVLGNDCFVGDGAVVTSDVKVYPFKSIEAGAVVTSSILWETRGARSVFGRRGASGIANVEITAELATRLAQAYGTSLKKGAVVTTSRDTSRVARALKRSVIGGLNLTGVNVEDVELATVPLTRFQVRNSQNAGGITVRLAAGDSERVEIRFFDSNGRDITELSQRKIERLLAREEFRRAFAGDIGDIVFPPRALEFYTAALEDSVDAERLQARAFKVVLDYSFGAASLALPAVLAKVGADVLAVNPFAATRPSSLGLDQREARVARIGTLVRSSGSDLGMLIDPAGETCALVDGSGRALDANQALGALLRLLVEARPGIRVALPVSATRVAADIVTSGGGRDPLDQDVGAVGHGGRVRVATSTSVSAPTARWSGPTSCPRSTRPRRSCTCSTCSPRPAGTWRPSSTRCRRCSPRSGRSPWSGPGRARSCARWSSGQRAATSCSSTGSRSTTATVGCSCCPTPTTPSSACSPRDPTPRRGGARGPLRPPDRRGLTSTSRGARPSPPTPDQRS